MLKMNFMTNLYQDGFCPLGPCIVSTEQIPNPAVLNLKTRLNGKIMQSGAADDMIFSIPEIVSYLSQVQNNPRSFKQMKLMLSVRATHYYPGPSSSPERLVVLVSHRAHHSSSSLEMSCG